MGRILRFDEPRGYGFIRPQEGGSDVFMHANDFLCDTRLLKPGTVVEFEVVESERGLRAVSVRSVDELLLAEPAAEAVPAITAPFDPVAGSARHVRSPACGEAVSASEFMQEVTDVIIDGAPTATGLQIAQIRQRLSEVARGHGWVLD
ncbi:cold shock domain-containing protein [Streptomyces echinatus]|uniref:cold shock domain-containing protein n=1 Tax=Streptomyces echinatus TaxID=67293 RepID=UPI0037969017